MLNTTKGQNSVNNAGVVMPLDFCISSDDLFICTKFYKIYPMVSEQWSRHGFDTKTYKA